MHERALETCEPSCVPRTTKHFFIPVVHIPLRTLGHVTALEVSHRGGRAWSGEACGSARALLGMEVRFRAIGHVAALEPTSAGRQGLELQDMWQHRSSPQYGGGVQGHMARGSARAHLSSGQGV
jgi:hypothetical protein